MAVYTRLSHEELQQITDLYQLGTLQHAREIAEGVENSNYMLTIQPDDETAEPMRTIFTIYEKRLNVDDLPFFLGIMEHLVAGGIDCPLPLSTKDGEQTIILPNGKTAAMISFLSGKSITSFQNAHIKSLGKAMAAMHKAADGFSKSRPNDLSLAGWQKLANEIGEQANSISPNLATQLQAELNWLDEHWPTGLPSGVIHADLFPDNVFYIGDDVSGIIDYYFACNDFYLYDLAIVMNAWCFENHAEFNITKARLLLQGYHHVRPISDAEKHALPILCRGAAMRFLLTRIYDWIHTPKDALVIPKNPKEYLKKLRFHQHVSHASDYGLV